LLQEREFIKTNENIYKIGMSRVINLGRFNQYPKGSILLYQSHCNDCKSIESILIKIFKTKFIHRSDIGNEYFEGNHKDMIDIIFQTIKNESTLVEQSITPNTKPNFKRVFEIDV
jgi:hypothetical protein